MTRKHFVQIAERIFEAGYLSDDQKLQVAQDLSDTFQKANPNFNRARFINACTGQD